MNTTTKAVKRKALLDDFFTRSFFCDLETDAIGDNSLPHFLQNFSLASYCSPQFGHFIVVVKILL
jgi:hypothetical protein